MQADVVQVEAMAAAARHLVVYISASVEEYMHVGLFATVRIFPILRMRIENTCLIHNNIHNTQMVIHNITRRMLCIMGRT